MKRSGFKRSDYATALAKQQWQTAKRSTARAPLKCRQPMNRGTKPLKAKPDPKLAAWSKAVKKRDGNRCKFNLFGSCATGDVRIDPHHIAPRGRRPDLIYDVQNGICLCRTHHNWCHDNPRDAERMGHLNFDSYELAQKIKTGYTVPGDKDDRRITL